MDGRLACQTDETTDARGLYALALGDCDDCLMATALRGASALLIEDDDASGGEITSLAKAGLALGQRADARANPRTQADSTEHLARPRSRGRR